MSRPTPNTPRAGSPTPGAARGAQMEALREQRARDRSERGTLARARWRQAVIFLLVVAALGVLLLRTAYWQLSQRGMLAGRADAEHLRAVSLPTGPQQGRFRQIDLRHWGRCRRRRGDGRWRGDDPGS